MCSLFAVDPNTLQVTSVNKLTLLMVARYLLIAVVAALVAAGMSRTVMARRIADA